MTARHIITDPDSALISSSDLPQSTEYNQASKTHDLVDQDLSFIPSVEKFNLLIQNQNECKCCQTKSISDATDLQDAISILDRKLAIKRCELRLALVERKALTAQLGIDRKKTFNNNNKKIKLESQKRVRINGISSRSGSYNNLMQQLAQSPFLHKTSR